MRRALVWAFVAALLGWPCSGIDLKVPRDSPKSIVGMTHGPAGSILPAGYGEATVSFQWEKLQFSFPIEVDVDTNFSGGSSPRIH
jgi:hypothetical protein